MRVSSGETQPNGSLAPHTRLAMSRSAGAAHRHALHVEHAVEAVGAAADAACVARPAVAYHNVVLVLLLGRAVRVDVVMDELPHGRLAPVRVRPPCIAALRLKHAHRRVESVGSC